MIKPLKTVVLTVVLGTLGAITIASAPACSSGGGCSGASKCSADPAPTQANIDQCNKLSGDACGSQYKDLLSCSQGQQKCAADNTTDGAATLAALQANCGTQTTAYATCCQANTGACQ